MVYFLTLDYVTMNLYEKKILKTVEDIEKIVKLMFEHIYCRFLYPSWLSNRHKISNQN